MQKLSPADTKALTQRVNHDLSSINSERHTGMPMKEIAAVLVGHDLDPKPVQDHLHGDEGRLHVQVGPEIWLVLTWYRMESGRYEIVAYATSSHDDHRDPYTTVMDAATKRKNAKKLTGLLVPINKTYYQGKAAAFGCVQDAIAACGFDWHEFEDRTTGGKVNKDDDGVHVAIGNGLYIKVSWYKMPSGRYEITSYVS